MDDSGPETWSRNFLPEALKTGSNQVERVWFIRIRMIEYRVVGNRFDDVYT